MITIEDEFETEEICPACGTEFELVELTLDAETWRCPSCDVTVTVEEEVA